MLIRMHFVKKMMPNGWLGSASDFVTVPAMDNRIAEIREQRNLSQRGLGKRVRAELTGATVGRLEAGKIQLTLDYMRRLARALGCLPADLLAVTDVHDDDGEATLVQMYRSLDDTDRSWLLTVVETILSRDSLTTDTPEADPTDRPDGQHEGNTVRLSG